MLKYMTVADAVKAVAGTWKGTEDGPGRRITEVVTDSRKAGEGVCFIAIPGERVDGHDFIPQVLEAGAACAISEREIEGVSGYILVEDTRKALRDLAAYYRQLLDIRVVGITGSVGKTSTKEMIASVLGVKYRTQKTAGNFNNEIGLPLTVFTITEEHQVAVLEMGISDFGEMSRLAAIARPDVMVITNIGQCHLENLGTRDGILKAKTECFDFLNEGASVVLNGKDDKLSAITEVGGRSPYFFGLAGDGFIADDSVYSLASDVVTKGLEGSDFLLTLNGEKKSIHVPVAGSHMVINAAAAAAVGSIMGMNAEEIAAGIEKCQAVAGRGRLIHTDRYLLVDDTYNANPVSMRAELDLLAETEGRRVAILGDMFELGTDEEQMHHDLGVYAYDRCDVLVCIGDLSSHMYEGAVTRGEDPENLHCTDIIYFKDKEGFLKEKEEILEDGDTILLKASHGMEFGRLLEELQKQGV